MAEKSKTTKTEEPAMGAGVASVTEELATEAQTKKVVEEFYAGEMKPGNAIRFVTRGGNAVPIVTKRGS